MIVVLLVTLDFVGVGRRGKFVLFPCCYHSYFEFVIVLLFFERMGLVYVSGERWCRALFVYCGTLSV